LSLIDVLLPVAALYFSMHTATIGPVPVTPVPKRIWGDVANYDGDTVQLQFNEGVSSVIFTVRIRELDTPEVKASCPEEKTKAQQAKKATTDFLARGPIFLTKVEPSLEMYGRVLASIAVQSPSGRLDDLADSLKADARGIARGYDVNAGRQSWCPTP
jgi:micrococcal nuclease